MGSIILSGLRDQNNGKKIGINGSRIYHVTTLLNASVRTFLLHYALEKLLHFALKDCYILR